MSIRKNTKLALCLILLVGLAACTKDGTDTMTELSIHLTDNPTDVTEVNVDIQQVRANFSDDSTGWVNINTRAGIYNLLDFQNGIDTVIATGIVPASTIKELRFVLGQDNTIKVDNAIYKLSIPSGSESGLKIKINRQLHAKLDSLVIDFDVASSILQTGAGDYKLSPVLKLK